MVAQTCPCHSHFPTHHLAILPPSLGWPQLTAQPITTPYRQPRRKTSSKAQRLALGTAPNTTVTSTIRPVPPAQQSLRLVRKPLCSRPIFQYEGEHWRNIPEVLAFVPADYTELHGPSAAKLPTTSARPIPPITHFLSLTNPEAHPSVSTSPRVLVCR